MSDKDDRVPDESHPEHGAADIEHDGGAVAGSDPDGDIEDSPAESASEQPKEAAADEKSLDDQGAEVGEGAEVLEAEHVAAQPVAVVHASATQQFFVDRSGFFFRLLRNWVGLLGTVLFGTSFVTFLFFFVIEIVAGEVNPYLGLFHFLVLPPITVTGLMMMVVGWWIERRKKRHALASGEVWAPLDISRVRVRQRLLLTTGGMSAFLVFAMAAGGYRAYEFTESTSFCGEVCHSVMHPEFIAYQSSPHARVSCVDCHVGEGASYYVQSKLSGLYQVYAVLRNIYPKPIPTPVHNLRPAQETCEKCHWPRYFFGDRRRVFTHFLTDGSEEPWEIDMLINIGGGDPDKGYDRGIHWHMNIANRVDYISRDEQRQDIPWVRIEDELGNITTYQNVDEPFTDSEIDERMAAGEMRQMDCLDCHNRPSHIYRSPVDLVNREMQLGNIDSSMPDIKFYALEVLANEYEDAVTAEQAITDGLRQAYSGDWPEYYAANRRQVDETAVVLKRVYNENIFPDMKVRWDTYPNFVGHWDTAGCFRCHAGNLQSSDGRVISTDCSSCHTILRQGFPSDPILGEGGRNPFVHPGDLEIMDEPILCHECHDGALGLGG